jgi:hypothetical protein
MAHPNTQSKHKRAAHDLYQSPPDAIDNLFRGFPAPPRDTIFADVGFGLGCLTWPLVRRGYAVHPLDVIDHEPDGNPFLIEGDFLAMPELPQGATQIVSNPPYVHPLCVNLIRHMLCLLPPGGCAHVLLQSNWPLAKRRQALSRHLTHVTHIGRAKMLPLGVPDQGQTPKADHSWFTFAEAINTSGLVRTTHLGL